MIYSKILNPKHKKLFRGIVIILLTVFSFSFYSCFTYKTEYYSPEELRTKDFNSVEEVKIKNDSCINLEKYDVTYLQNKDTSKDALQWLTTDTIFLKLTPQKVFKINNSFSQIKLNDIIKAKVETKKFNLGKTLLYSGGVVIGILLISLIAWLIHPGKIINGSIF